MKGADLLLVGGGQAAQAHCILGAGMGPPWGHMASKEWGEEMETGDLHWS